MEEARALTARANFFGYSRVHLTIMEYVNRLVRADWLVGKKSVTRNI
jgi:hypothetical protein